jgi:addiction module HigA family antidote
VDLSRKHMSAIVNGHSRVEPELAARMAKVLGTTTELWINLQAAVDAYDATLAVQTWKPKKTFRRVSA